MNKKNSIVCEALGILVSAIFVLLGCKVAASSDLPKSLDSKAENRVLIIKYRADGSKEITDGTGKPLGPVVFTSVNNQECCICYDGGKIYCHPDLCLRGFVTGRESLLESGQLKSVTSASCLRLLERIQESFEKKKKK
jgi:hypothetical protein